MDSIINGDIDGAESNLNANTNFFDAVESKIKADAAISNDSHIEWVDSVVLNELTTAGMFGSSHEWRGSYWNVLYRATEQHFQFYVGADDMTNLSEDLIGKTVSVRMVFLDAGGSEYGSCYDCSLFIQYRYGQRHDVGFGNKILLSTVKDEIPKIRGDTICTKITVSELWQPAVVPSMYDSKTATGMVGLENMGATCYLNALLQMLFHINSFRRAVYNMPVSTENGISVTLALQTIFNELQISSTEVSTKILLAAFGWTAQEQFTQQDVQEMMRILLDNLEEKMKGTVADGVIKSLFCGKERSYIRCLNVKYESTRTQDFYDVQLDVRGCKDVYESFRKYVAKEMLDGDNQYDAEQFGKQDAEKGVIFAHFPPVLTIHLKRFDYDPMMGFVKVHDRYEFPTRLCLDEFVVSSESRDAELSSHKSNTYLLHSVLVHAGDVGGGHYYAFIRPNLSTDVASIPWYKFNDEIVLKVSEREAVENCFGANAGNKFSSAYMLVYINEAAIGDIMTPVSAVDVPVALRRRLQLQSWVRSIDDKNNLLERSFVTVRYFTDDQVSLFSKYGKGYDFINPSECLTLRVPVDSPYLKLILEISKALKCEPIKIRLWNCRKRRFVDGERCIGSYHRIAEPLPAHPKSRVCDTDLFYVEFVSASHSVEYETQMRELKIREECWRKRVIEEIESINNMSNLRREMQFWREELLSQSDQFESAVTGDDTLAIINQCFEAEEALSNSEHLYAGCTVRFLQRHLTEQSPAQLELREDLKRLNNDYLGVINAFGPKEFDESFIKLFVKVYDVQNIYPSWLDDSSCDGSTNESAVASIPLKYIGQCTIPKSLSSCEFGILVESYLQYCVRSEDKHLLLHDWCVEFGDSILSDASLNSTMEVWKLCGCNYTKSIFDTEEDAPNNFEMGDVLVIESDKTHYYARDWLKKMANQRHFLLLPVTDSDKAFAHAMLQDRSKDGRSSPGSNIELTDITGAKRNRESTDRLSSLAEDDENVADYSQVMVSVVPSESIVHLLDRFGSIPTSHIVFLAERVERNGIADHIVCDESKRIDELISLPAQAQTKLISVYYRFSPLPMLEEVAPGMLQDGRIANRYLEIEVNDYRLQQWRKRVVLLAKSHKLCISIDKLLEASDDGTEPTGSKRSKRDVSTAVAEDSRAIYPELNANYFSNLLESHLSDDKIYCKIEKTKIVGDLMVEVREHLGIPKNISADGAILTDGEQPADQDSLIDTDRLCQPFSESQVDKGGKTVVPSYPVMLLLARKGCITGIVNSGVPVSRLPKSCLECDGYLLPQLIVQHCGPRELKLLSENDGDAFLVSVVNFTLYGSAVLPLNSEAGNPKPFMSYICQTDEYDDVCSRFEEVLGPTDWTQCRLALVIDSRPIYLPKSVGKLDLQGISYRDQFIEGLCDLSVLKLQTGEAKSAFCNFIDDHIGQNRFNETFRCTIGIQRSSSSISRAMSYYSHKAIKIS